MSNPAPTEKATIVTRARALSWPSAPDFAAAPPVGAAAAAFVSREETASEYLALKRREAASKGARQLRAAFAVVGRRGAVWWYQYLCLVPGHNAASRDRA
jgi:hypothetical protein